MTGERDVFAELAGTLRAIVREEVAAQLGSAGAAPSAGGARAELLGDAAFQRALEAGSSGDGGPNLPERIAAALWGVQVVARHVDALRAELESLPPEG